MAKEVNADQWRVSMGHAASLEGNREYYLASHPGKEGVFAILPNETKTHAPDYLRHLEKSNADPTTIEGRVVRTDPQKRVTIPPEFRENHEKRAMVTNLGGVPFVILGRTPEERKRKLQTMTGKGEHEASTKKPRIHVPNMRESPERIIARQKALRRGTKEHRKNMAFSKHRKRK
jgi:hypothetical protein